MTDISGVPAFGGGGFALRMPAISPQAAVAPVAATADGGSATHMRGQDLPGQATGANGTTTPTEASKTEDKAKKASESSGGFDPNMLVGPTPAFEASLLEVESDLKSVLAKIEAERSAKSDEKAIAAPKAETAKADESRDVDEKPKVEEPERPDAKDSAPLATTGEDAELETPFADE